MKKSFFALFMALMAIMTVSAEDYTGTIYVTRNGQTNSQTTTVTVTQQDNGLNTLMMHVMFMNQNLELKMTDVPSDTFNGITTYSAERTVATGTYFGSMYTIVFARVTDGMMAANVSIPAYGVTMWFNTVGDHFQLPNSDFEAWNDDINEPNHWHSFMTAYGDYAGTSQSLAKLEKSEDVHAGSTGNYSAVMTAKKFIFVVANGTMTNGRLKAGSMSATDPENHAEMDKNSTVTDPNGDLFYMPVYAKPDKFNVWLKFTTSNSNNRANVSVKTFDGTYYQEPSSTTYNNVSGSIVGGTDVTQCDWTQHSFPFDYDSYAANNAATEAIFVDFATNTTPGQGNDGDALYVDDMELVYLGEMTDLRYQDETLDGWDPTVTTYSIETIGEPNLDDFTADIEGASAVLTKTMEQNADGTYRIAISVVSGDLQTATCYIITATATTPAFIPGDVNNDGSVSISDVTDLIDYLLGSDNGINQQAADLDNSGEITIADVTMLIDKLLTGN